MAYDIEQIEDAVIAALAPLKDAIGVREIKSYQGELEEADLRKTVKNFPAIYVIYGGSEYTAHGARKIESPGLTLFVADRTLRGEEEARRGGANNPGTYRMLRECRRLLCGRNLGLDDLNPLEILRDAPVWFGSGISVYAQEYESAQGHLYPLSM